MDIYINEETDDELDKIAQIPPGIGCPVYLSPGTPLPILHAHQIQLVAVENIVGPTSSSTRNEVTIDSQLLKLQHYFNYFYIQSIVLH